jgi:hypothetical protein
MGRPLNKKYFGNRNVGVAGNQVDGNLSNSQNYADDRIGGEGILSITPNATLGSVLVNSSYPAPTLVKPAPAIPGGVTSTSRVIWEVASIVMTSGGSAYSAPDTVTFTGLGGSVVGKMTATGAGPTNAATAAGINFTDAGASRGEFINTPPIAALTYEVVTTAVPTGTTNGQCQVFFRVKRIEVLTSGSGYTGNETFSWNTAGTSGTPPGVPTFAKTADTGNVGSATNQENAIVIRANTSAGGTTAKVGDIIRQVSTRRYKVKTADGIKICALGIDNTPAPFGAYIVATAASGGTYYVTKLTGRKATLSAKTGNDDLDGQAVQWTFGAPSGSIVQIENA